MNKQKGQSVVEFAFIVPIFFMMCFGMVYGGILFMDYIQFNNAARGVAREIALTTNANDRNRLKNDFEQHKGEYFNQLTKLYEPTPKVTVESDSITVEISLIRNDEDLPRMFTALNFPPEKLNPITVVMPVEIKETPNEGDGNEEGQT